MNTLITLQETIEQINEGRKLLIAGDDRLLSRLPAGEWIAGTIPYFMTVEGGIESTDKLFVTEISNQGLRSDIRTYSIEDIASVSQDGPDHGVSFIIMPAFSGVHAYYAKLAPDFPQMFIKPILGWVAGVNVNEIGKTRPKVYDGRSAQAFDNHAVVMHLELPSHISAKIDIINVFEADEGPTITFPEATFNVRDCFIDGKLTNFARYIRDNAQDTRLPLVTDLCGAVINASIANIDVLKEEVVFYGPVFPGHTYHFAKPIPDYAKTFAQQVPSDLKTVFSCNCILNYIYGELEGKTLAGTSGPITFGEIAYQLLNQTMVFLELQSTEP